MEKKNEIQFCFFPEIINILSLTGNLSNGSQWLSSAWWYPHFCVIPSPWELPEPSDLLVKMERGKSRGWHFCD